MTDTAFVPQHHAVNAWRRETFAPGTPSDATITERRLWAVNPQDYEWRSQYLHEIPDWLAGYFGNHAHAVDVYYLNTSQQFAKVGAGGQWAGGAGTQATYAGGDHAHSVYIGAHDHIVGIGAHAHSVYIGAHSHGVTVSPSGQAENTVKNTAFNYLVRLA